MLKKEQREAIYRLALQQQYDDLSDYLDSITAPEGWQLVPVEPTPIQIADGLSELMRVKALTGSDTAKVDSIYRATLAAAPKPGDSNE